MTQTLIRIDQHTCTGCGLCVEDCPGLVLHIKDKKAAFVGPVDGCMECQHCVAICPVGAVNTGGVDCGPVFETIVNDGKHIKPGDYDEADLLALMRSRRSCRAFKEEPIAKEILEDLVKAGTTAPSGTNSQMWTFTIVPNRDSVVKFADKVGDFYRKLNKSAANGLMRFISKLFMKDALGIYYRGYAPKVAKALDAWDNDKVDRLFFGAPAVIVIGQKPEASCPAEDSLLAAANMELAAHAMGLGTCLIGFAVEAMKRDPLIKQAMGIPPNEKIYAVMIVGKPARKYTSPAGRKVITPRYFRLSE